MFVHGFHKVSFSISTFSTFERFIVMDERLNKSEFPVGDVNKPERLHEMNTKNVMSNAVNTNNSLEV